MKIKDIVYEMEHIIIPKYLFENSDKFITDIFENESYLYTLVQNLAYKHNLLIPYRKAQFAVNGGRVSQDKDLIAIRIDYPYPEESPLCYCAYIICGLDISNPAYFAVQKNVSKKKDNPVIVMYTSDREHINIGESTFDNHKEYFDCIEAYEKFVQ